MSDTVVPGAAPADARGDAASNGGASHVRPPLTGLPLVLMTLGVGGATFMEVLDITIANVAVPTIAGDLGVATDQGTWVVSSYSVAAAIAVPLTGWLARRFGEVRLFITSVILFTLSSMLCGLATDLHTLVILRVIQGLVSGPMVPLSQALLLSNYSVQRRGMALALWTMIVVVAPICGPILGGWISENLSWPFMFFINAPIGVIAVLITWVALRGRETPTARVPIDYVGLVLLVVGVGSLQFVLDNGKDLDWFGSPMIVGLTAAAVVAITFLVAWELTDRHPIVDLSLFSRRNFTVGVVVLCLGTTGFFSATIIFPLWLQTTMGYTPSWAGIATAASGVSALIVAPIVGRNLARLNLRVMVSVSFVTLTVVSFWFASFTLDSSIEQLMMPRFLQGVAVSCFFIPTNSIYLAGLPASRLAAAAGLANFLRTFSAGLATAISVTLWDHRASYHHARLAENITPWSPATQSYLGDLRSLGIEGDAAHAQLERVLNTQAFMLATNDLFWLAGVMFMALVGVVWFARPPFRAGGPGGAH